MNLSKILKQVDFSVPNELLANIKRETKNIVSLLNKEIRKRKIKSGVFIGGSFSKGTISKSKEYDIDIFVRFESKNRNISKHLEKISNSLKNIYKIEKVHGSRDYFKVFKTKEITFEIIPVMKIKKPEEAENVTDLSYFHVNYVKKRMNEKLAREIRIAKQFLKAQKCYGAEGYIQGFSGYGVECLIIYFKSFEKMLRELLKDEVKIIIDPEKYYKNKNDVFIHINESKLQSPIILVDPTWKGRNVLAALSEETFSRFKEAGKKLIASPKKEYFEERRLDEKTFRDKSKKYKAEMIKIYLETNKQQGDIAGTKLKKFSRFIRDELEKYFKIIYMEFEYYEEKDATIYLIVKSKGDIEKKGPPVKMKENAENFRNENKNVYERNGILYSKVKIGSSAKKFLESFKEKHEKQIEDMAITRISLY